MSETSLTELILTLTHEVRGLAPRLEALQERADRHDAGLQALLERADRHDARSQALQERADRQDATLISVRTTLMERMDRLQNAVSGLRDDLVVNLSSNDRVDRANQALREELNIVVREILGPMRNKLMRLEDEVRELRGGLG